MILVTHWNALAFPPIETPAAVRVRRRRTVDDARVRVTPQEAL
jgi:hypothetical protein